VPAYGENHVILAAFLIAMDSGPRLASPAPVGSDEYVYRAGGATLLLAEQIEEPVIADPNVEREFARIGIDRACAIYSPRMRSVITAYEQRFRPLLIQSMRARVSPEYFDGNHLIAWGGAQMEARKRLIAMDIERSGDNLFARARAELRRRFLEKAARAPGTDPKRAPGAFADWHLDKPIARRIACSILRGPADSFAKRKQIFDVFYRKMGNE
jgi:hypothetical protein